MAVGRKSGRRLTRRRKVRCTCQLPCWRSGVRWLPEAGRQACERTSESSAPRLIPKTAHVCSLLQNAQCRTELNALRSALDGVGEGRSVSSPAHAPPRPLLSLAAGSPWHHRSFCAAPFFEFPTSVQINKDIAGIQHAIFMWRRCMYYELPDRLK